MYRSFLLRVWCQDGGRVRATIEAVDTGEVHTFRHLDQLCEWLGNSVDETSSTVDSEGSPS